MSEGQRKEVSLVRGNMTLTTAVMKSLPETDEAAFVVFSVVILQSRCNQEQSLPETDEAAFLFFRSLYYNQDIINISLFLGLISPFF